MPGVPCAWRNIMGGARCQSDGNRPHMPMTLLPLPVTTPRLSATCPLTSVLRKSVPAPTP